LGGAEAPPEPKGDKMEKYDINNFYTVVEEFRASHMNHFHVNDIYVVHMEDIDRTIQMHYKAEDISETLREIQEMTEEELV
jgi:hypothetical protein